MITIATIIDNNTIDEDKDERDTKPTSGPMEDLSRLLQPTAEDLSML